MTNYDIGRGAKWLFWEWRKFWITPYCSVYFIKCGLYSLFFNNWILSLVLVLKYINLIKTLWDEIVFCINEISCNLLNLVIFYKRIRKIINHRRVQRHGSNNRLLNSFKKCRSLVLKLICYYYEKVKNSYVLKHFCS